MQGHADKHFPCDESGDTDGYGKGITYKTRSIPETHFDLKRLTANRAGLIHLHKMFELVGIVVFIQIASATTGAFVEQYAPEEVGFMIVIQLIGTHII